MVPFIGTIFISEFNIIFKTSTFLGSQSYYL